MRPVSSQRREKAVWADPRENGRHSGKRRRWALFSLTVLIVLSTMLYAGGVIETAYGIRRRNALDRNEATAHLIARLLDEQAEAGRGAMALLSKRRLLQGAIARKDGRDTFRHLKDAVDTVPDLVFVVAYHRDGTLVSSYPGGVSPLRNAASEEWFRSVTAAAGQPYVSDALNVRFSGYRPQTDVRVRRDVHRGCWFAERERPEAVEEAPGADQATPPDRERTENRKLAELQGTRGKVRTADGQRPARRTLQRQR